MRSTGVKLDAETIRAIEQILRKGDRVELIPTKDGVAVIHVRREKVNMKTSS